jgi:hypothetical protein
MTEGATYSKTRLGGDQIDAALTLTPRGKRIVWIIVAAVVAVCAGLGAWTAVTHDSYSTSANGCVNVLVSSATGGGRLHYCGAEAVTFCRQSFASSDAVSLAARPQCDAAGLTKAKVAPAS